MGRPRPLLAAALLLAGCAAPPGPCAPLGPPPQDGVGPNTGGPASQAPALSGFVPAGRRMLVQLGEPIGLGTSHAGQRFRATLAQPVADDAGRLLIPPGSVVTGHVADLQPAFVALAFDEIRIGDVTYPLSAEVIGTDIDAAHHAPDWRRVVAGGTRIALGPDGAGELLPPGAAVGLALREGIDVRPPQLRHEAA
jgi:hypothetical protein